MCLVTSSSATFLEGVDGNNGCSARLSALSSLDAYSTGSLPLLSGVSALPCSLYDLLGHGETGGDGRILIVSGVLWREMGGSVFSGL